MVVHSLLRFIYCSLFVDWYILLPNLKVLQGVRSASGGSVVRFVHFCAGDGIFTNCNAASRVLWQFLNVLKSSLFLCLVVFIVCASHSANRLVKVAICSDPLAKIDDVTLVESNFVRFYKYLLPSYADDFGFELRHFFSSPGY